MKEIRGIFTPEKQGILNGFVFIRDFIENPSESEKFLRQLGIYQADLLKARISPEDIKFLRHIGNDYFRNAVLEIQRQSIALRESVSGIFGIMIKVHDSETYRIFEMYVKLLIESLEDRFRNPRLQDLTGRLKLERRVLQIIIGNYEFDIERIKKFLEKGLNIRQRYFLNLVLNQLLLQVNILQQCKMVHPDLINSLKNQFYIVQRAIKEVVDLHLHRVKGNMPNMFISHTITKQEDFLEIIRSGQLLSTRDRGESMHVNEMDQILGLDKYIYFFLGWGISDRDHYTLIYDAEKMLHLGAFANYVKYDQVLLAPVFVYLLFKEYFSSGHTLDDDTEARRFMMEFEREKVTPRKVYSMLESARFTPKYMIDLANILPGEFVSAYSREFFESHIKPNEIVNRRVIISEVEKYFEDTRVYSRGGKGNFLDWMPEIRTSSPFPVFNNALIGFFIPFERIGNFLTVFVALRLEGENNLLIYTMDQNKLSRGTVGEYRSRYGV